MPLSCITFGTLDGLRFLRESFTDFHGWAIRRAWRLFESLLRDSWVIKLFDILGILFKALCFVFVVVFNHS